MKLSTINWLSKAIALPLFIATLTIATSASAEQIARSRTSTSIGRSSISLGVSRARIDNRIPAVTELNLTIPVEASISSVDSPKPARIVAHARSSKAIRTNTSPTVSRERSIESNSSSKRSILALNSESSPALITKDSQKSKSSSRQRIAAGSRPPFSGNYLKLVRDPSKGTNDLGNPIYTLEAYANGQKIQTFDAVSGTAYTQNADRHLGNNLAPLPDGLYEVSNQIVTGTVSEVGKTFIGIFPKFETHRNELGIHLDRSFNKRNGSDGTAGCIGITTIADRDAINEFVVKYHPNNLIVSILTTEAR
jgi:hypothetical protein